MKRRRRERLPPTPDAVERRMLGQALIDRLLRASAPLTRPATERLERAWLSAVAYPGLSRATGRLADAALPRPVLARLIDAWIKAYDVDMSIAEVPPDGFSTFDAFFTRRLLPGTRPIDHDPNVLVSPADSVLKGFGVVDARGRIPEVKGRMYALGALIGGASTSDVAYHGGTWGVYYLSPRDYHRVHAPGAGVVTSIRELHGTSYPVNDRGVRHVEGLFVKNKRTAFTIDGDDGRMLLVMVGAMNVGRITASVAAGDRIDKGQELGIFHLGSTVVLVTEAASGFAYRRVHEGEWVRMGQAVMQRS